MDTKYQIHGPRLSSSGHLNIDHDMRRHLIFFPSKLLADRPHLGLLPREIVLTLYGNDDRLVMSGVRIWDGTVWAFRGGDVPRLQEVLPLQPDCPLLSALDD